jgi:hypothetical protein
MFMIRVSITEVGGVTGTFPVEENSTVRDVLEVAGVNPETAKTIRLNSSEGHLGDAVRDGDSIYVIPNITGN